MEPEIRYPHTPIKELDPSGISTYSVHDRPGKVSVDHIAKGIPSDVSFKGWLESLPDILAARDLKLAAQAIHRARKEGKGVLLGMGAHPIKVGLGGLIAEALADRLFTGVATNGAAIIHDYELALTGKTSEDVDAVLSEGTFGMAEETSAQLNKTISDGAGSGEGIGYPVGKLIARQGLPHADVSVFASAYRNQIPATVHVALGTDIIHMHPTCDGAATGKATLDDFHLFARQVAALENGVFINLGSAVIIPEVFLKACSLALNLGYSLEGLTTVNMDFIQHYRPRVNVVERPTDRTGRGISLTGHHELLLPLLLAAVRDLD
jgi:hypothetical protein